MIALLNVASGRCARGTVLLDSGSARSTLCKALERKSHRANLDSRANVASAGAQRPDVTLNFNVILTIALLNVASGRCARGTVRHLS